MQKKPTLQERLQREARVQSPQMKLVRELILTHDNLRQELKKTKKNKRENTEDSFLSAVFGYQEQQQEKELEKLLKVIYTEVEKIPE